MNFTDIKLGQLLSSSSQIIKRNALSILKQLQKQLKEEQNFCRQCGYEKSIITTLKTEGGAVVLMKEHCPECSYHWERPPMI